MEIKYKNLQKAEDVGIEQEILVSFEGDIIIAGVQEEQFKEEINNLINKFAL